MNARMLEVSSEKRFGEHGYLFWFSDGFLGWLLMSVFFPCVSRFLGGGEGMGERGEWREDQGEPLAIYLVSF